MSVQAWMPPDRAQQTRIDRALRTFVDGCREAGRRASSPMAHLFLAANQTEAHHAFRELLDLLEEMHARTREEPFRREEMGFRYSEETGKVVLHLSPAAYTAIRSNYQRTGRGRPHQSFSVAFSGLIVEVQRIPDRVSLRERFRRWRIRLWDAWLRAGERLAARRARHRKAPVATAAPAPSFGTGDALEVGYGQGVATTMQALTRAQANNLTSKNLESR